MVLAKSFLAAAKWTIVFFLILQLLAIIGIIVTSAAVFSVLGFVVLFIVFTLENLELRY
ncbi:MAG: hypothetical protein HYW50_01230 [Candidatus Diapherotrites archaeon]|nr:hypothetical protein [Candidatus Diapherotrites archaeon]